MALGIGPNKLSGDANSISGTSNVALNERVHPQFLCDLRGRLMGTGVRHRGSVRDNAERADFGKVGRQFVGDAIGKKLLVWVGRHVCEWKDHDRPKRLRTQDSPTSQRRYNDSRRDTSPNDST